MELYVFYFMFLTNFLTNFLGKFDLLMLCGDIESSQAQGLIPVKASQFATEISVA